MLELAYFLGMSSSEIGTEIGVSVGTIKSRTAAAMPMTPSNATRDRFIGALETSERYGPLLAKLSSLIDLPTARVRQLVASLVVPASWEAGPALGVQLIHFDAGPLAHAADAGFVRVRPGATFPEHKHLGREMRSSWRAPTPSSRQARSCAPARSRNARWDRRTPSASSRKAICCSRSCSATSSRSLVPYRI